MGKRLFKNDRKDIFHAKEESLAIKLAVALDITSDQVDYLNLIFSRFGEQISKFSRIFSVAAKHV